MNSLNLRTAMQSDAGPQWISPLTEDSILECLISYRDAALSQRLAGNNRDESLQAEGSERTHRQMVFDGYLVSIHGAVA